MAHPAFEIVQQPDKTFDVILTAADGRLKTVGGFGSEHEATAWIVQTERALYDADPRLRIQTRDKGHS